MTDSDKDAPKSDEKTSGERCEPESGTGEVTNDVNIQTDIENNDKNGSIIGRQIMVNTSEN